VDEETVSSQDRPTSASYDRFAYPVKFFVERCYDEERIRDDCPFLIQDVLFNSLMDKSEKDLAEIARVLDQDPSPFEERPKKTARAINENLWDEEKGTYLDYDSRSGADTGVTRTQPDRAALRGRARPITGKACGRVPGVRRFRPCGRERHAGPELRHTRLRVLGSEILEGAVWINMDWFLMHGLED
jgi:Trehalase